MGVKTGYKRTEVGVIPGDWEVKPLAAIADKMMVGIASAATHAYRAKGVPMFRNQNIKAGFLDDSDLLFVAPEYEVVFKNKRLRGGDLLTMRTGYPGVTAVVPPRYDSAQSFTTLITRPRQREAQSDYLCHFINSESGQRFFTQSQIGGAQKNVNVGTLRKMPIPLPKPHEQRAIAEALGDVDSLLAALDRLIAKKRDLKQAAMQQLLTGRTRLPGFSGEWERCRFGQIARIRNEKRIADHESSLLPCVELEHIGQGDGRLLGISSASLGSSKYLFRRGDILFGRLRAYLRKFWMADRDGLCSTEIWPLTPCDERLLPEYLRWLVESNGFAEAAGVAYGTHMPRSEWATLATFEIGLPKPNEQAQIAIVIADLDGELAALERRRDKIRDLKQAMMQELLTGRIRLCPSTEASE
jgi:type I restriction enzyme S subunit